MKNKKKQAKKLDLDQEVVADLEASDDDTGAIKGGGYTFSCSAKTGSR